MTITTMTMPNTISGFADETMIGAGYIAQKLKEIFNKLQTSNALGFAAKGTFCQIDEIYNECSVEGWDGGNAKSISEEVVGYAKTFLKSFPLGFEPPEIGAEPDGAITLEWYNSPNKVISISINSDGWLYYAAINGSSRIHGMEFVLDNVSERLLELIMKIIRPSI